MCGINGFFNPYMNFYKEECFWKKILQNMNDKIKHRGPDDNGLFLCDKCGLSHVRLSIIDLKNGHQPMTRKISDTRQVTVVFNGEIYNMHLIRNLLEPYTSFYTTSDTEVILNGYIQYGIKILNMLNGIFALAIYDSESGLYLIRDRLGVKPLFYTEIQSDIIFSSEIKGLFCHPLVKPVIDINSMKIILGLGPAKRQGSGVFKNIREVLPGHYLHCTKDGIEDVTYWELKSKFHEDDPETTIEKTAELLDSAISMEMLSDIPVCTFLSGGIDSSIISAICSENLRKSNQVLTTYSFDFTENNIYFKSNSFQPSEDRPYVNIVKDHIKSAHIFLECDYENLYSLLFDTVDARDLPCMTDVESSLMYFCSRVSDNHKVALTGECADEIFGGYPWFHREDMFNADIFPWSMDLCPRLLLLKDDVKDELNIPEYVKMEYFSSLAKVPVLLGENKTEARRRELAFLNITWFMSTLLDRMDRTSMYNGLEARVPFADHRIVEYVFNVPWSIKYTDNKVKGLLRKSAEYLNILPDEIIYRKKSPYPKTYHPKYEKILCDNFMEIIHNTNEPVLDYIDTDKAVKFINEKKSYDRPWYGQLMAGPQLIAYFIQINYWLKKFKG